MAWISKRAAGSTVSTLVTGPCRVVSVRWTGATTPGHTCTITNTAGDVLWSSIASAANYVEESPLSDKWQEPVDGVKITVIGSGSVALFYRQ